ncbi:MAG TPA: uroporphyrinogen-III synthase [Candidatus Acidoferrales bacterium]|nr:uroporphyrinogen-III synthase [Candidatus Acidoferrales bacterium]
MTRSTLRGRRILVTRARHQAEDLLELLRECGAEPVSVPVMQLEPLLSERGFRELGEGISAGKWDDVVFTSANAVRLVLPQYADEFLGARIFAIGPGTSAAARDRGWRVEPLPESFVAESLVKLLVGAGVSGRRVLLPRAAGAREVLPEALARAGAQLEPVALYRMTPDESARSALAAALAEPELDCIVFASGSSVDCFQALWSGRELPLALLVACIGPITASSAEAAGLHPGLVASEHSLAGLVDALELQLGPLPENGRQS